MNASRHTFTNFEDALTALRENILMMGSLTERNLLRATNGLLKRDSELCNAAIVDDEEVDLLEKEIDLTGIEIITRYQPVASDLRVVVSAMRISSNLERIADQATSIARRARKLNQHPSLDEVVFLEPMLQKVMSLLRDSLRAYSEHNTELARTFKERDREIDALNKEVTGRLTGSISQNTDAIPGYLNLIFIARNLERVGDHSTNIGEDIVFAESAEDIRHSQSRLVADS